MGSVVEPNAVNRQVGTWQWSEELVQHRLSTIICNQNYTKKKSTPSQKWPPSHLGCLGNHRMSDMPLLMILLVVFLLLCWDRRRMSRRQTRSGSVVRIASYWILDGNDCVFRMQCGILYLFENNKDVKAAANSLRWFFGPVSLSAEQLHRLL